MFLSVLLLSLAVVNAKKVVYGESHTALPYWQRGEVASGSLEHEILIATKQKSAEDLESLLLDIATPGSRSFRKWLTYDEVGEIAIAKEDVAGVMNWLAKEKELKISRVSRRGEYIRVKATIEKWTQVFECTFYHWSSANDQSPALRCDQDFSLDSELAKHVHHVFQVSDQPPRVHNSARMLEMSNDIVDDTTITPSTLNSFYNIDSNIGSSKVYQGVFETSASYYSPDDLAEFQSKYDLPSDQVDTDYGGHASSTICSGTLGSSLCGEANLDVQYMMAVSQMTPMTYYFVSGSGDLYTEFAEYISGLSETFVGSISYGSIESEVSSATKKTFDTEAAKLSLTGSTLFVSSGDAGVAGFGATSKSECGYNPSYPASSPYVTAVGATYASTWTSASEEVVCESDLGSNVLITSGGGFSDYYEIPSWQSDAVSDFLKGTSAVSGYGTGRGYPDIALAGHGYQVYIGDTVYSTDGTSCSTPVAAGMLSLVNAIRAEANTGDLASTSGAGFINPTLYSDTSYIANDITSGSNSCVAEDEFCCSQGFDATTGWDPTTGWGSIDFENFVSVFTSDLDPIRVKEARSKLRNWHTLPSSTQHGNLRSPIAFQARG